VTAHDPALLAALHVTPGGRRELAALGARDHVAVQESTLAALLDGAYDGDLTIGELLAHGDHGIGTLNGLDGELVIVDGEAWRAGADGTVERVRDAERTPFAVATVLGDAERVTLPGPLGDAELHAVLDAHVPPGAGADLVRIDGRFTRIHARSVPRQHPPYRPLAEVAAQMVEWTWHDLDATVVGFRFGDGQAGLEVVGHHLHVLSADRTRAGHVLGCDLLAGVLRTERLDDLRVALPAGITMPEARTFRGAETVRRLEGE
jgi:acetolactate decarboxylase